MHFCVVESFRGCGLEFYNFRETMGPPRSVLRKEEPVVEEPVQEQVGVVLFRALRPFPAALVAVREALKELFGEREPFQSAVPEPLGGT